MAKYYDSEDECETWDEVEGIESSGHVEIGQYVLPIEAIQPYLFPLSSLTKEQKSHFKEMWDKDMDKSFDYAILGEDELYGLCLLSATTNVIDWFNKNHFDWRGLIPIGLAEDATGLNIY